MSGTQAASDDVLIARPAQGDRLAWLAWNEQVAEDLIGEVLDGWRQGKTGRSICRFHMATGDEGIVGIAENTVATRLFHARKKLAELLKAAGVERGWP